MILCGNIPPLQILWDRFVTHKVDSSYGRNRSTNVTGSGGSSGRRFFNSNNSDKSSSGSGGSRNNDGRGGAEKYGGHIQVTTDVYATREAGGVV